MNSHGIKCFRLYLRPDPDFPIFKRLFWEKTPTHIRDVLMNGIHPWFDIYGDGGADPSLTEALVMRLNGDDAKIADIESVGYCGDIRQKKNHWPNNSCFERTLEHIQQSIYFVDALTYPKLLEIAMKRLRECWSHTHARSIAEKAYLVFQDLRQFLKAKDKKLKLSGYEDIDRYDLGRVLSLEDFEGRDAVLISEAIPAANFRKVSWLNAITDETMRLRLVPEIPRLTLTLPSDQMDERPLCIHVERIGENCRFFPDIENCEDKRRRAERFAKAWRMDAGQLCFAATVDRLADMLEADVVHPSFPNLDYMVESSKATATAEVRHQAVPLYHISNYYECAHSLETLRGVLREFGVSMTGSKDVVLRKIAKLAAQKYAEHQSEMDAFFCRHRFIHINVNVKNVAQFPPLKELPSLSNLLLTMYAIKHLRGNAVLDATYENNTCTEEQLAYALMTEAVELCGAFLRVE